MSEAIESDEPDLSDAETLDQLMQGMTEVCGMLEEQSKILLDIGNRLAKLERLTEDIERLMEDKL